MSAYKVGRVKNQITIDGVSFVTEEDVYADGTQSKGKSGDTALAAAKVGQLTTRTDNDTGVITMTTGHGFVTGDRLDVYWAGGSRRGMTATVATDAVTVDGGAGDNLPNNLTAVTASVPAEEEFLVTGDNAQFIAAKSNRLGMVVFTDAADAEVFAVAAPLADTTGGGYQWYTGNGVTNPLAGADVAKVYFSNGDSSNANTISAVVGAS